MEYFNNKVLECEDGSKTLVHSIIGDTYHSTKGSLAESSHVYIKAGLEAMNKKDVNIFEVGFGTGINAILTLINASQLNINIHYHTIELYPISQECVASLELDKILANEEYNFFINMHKASWNEEVEITKGFTIHKIFGDFTKSEIPQNIDLVYFDAFAPDTQPELWSNTLLEKIYNSMTTKAILVTYSAKGSVKEALRSVGFEVVRLKGALGKHHMVRATKQ